MSKMKAFIEGVSVQIGDGGQITERSLREAQRYIDRLKSAIKDKRRRLDAKEKS